jgi:hypothetical protein
MAVNSPRKLDRPLKSRVHQLAALPHDQLATRVLELAQWADPALLRALVTCAPVDQLISAALILEEGRTDLVLADDVR